MKKFNAKQYLLLTSALVSIILIALYIHLLAPLSALNNTHFIYIDSDDTQDSVFSKLEPACNEIQLNGFKSLARHFDYKNNIHTGKYAIEPKTSVLQVYRHIKNGMQTPVKVTIPEVRTMEAMAKYLSTKLMLDSTTLASAFTDSSFCAKFNCTPSTLPSIFIPETHEFYWNVSLEKFMATMNRTHRHFWNQERTAKAKSLGMTSAEVSTLASIIDEETANNNEKPLIAGMYINRLNKDMPLQADPTIKFAIKDFKLRRIYHKHLLIDSPYNTYKNTGLPPGPVKIASIKGIDAVLNYTKHEWLYMCAKEDFSGTHNFAKTYKEHLANAKKYIKALNDRDIR